MNPQAGIVAAFAAGAVDGAPAPVEHIETHLSHVFLSGDRAFKLMRAVHLSFVDFSTLARRRAACEAEIALNQLTAPGLYLCAFPLVRAGDGTLRIGGEGEVLDWVVAMRRFDQAAQFDRLARAGKLDRNLVEQTAAAIARLHATAPVTRLAGHAADYRELIRGLRRTELDGAEKRGLAPGSPELFDQLDYELTSVSALIEDRREQGQVRRGHGDLHLRNICLFEGKPTLFDALEFDERMATTDVLYDLAFLLMDLRHKSLDVLANAAMNAYWDAAGESESALGLLCFFMSLRAAVRMAVAVEAGDFVEAQSYRALGLRLLQREAPILLAIGGLSGSGKSAVAKEMAPKLPGAAGARILRTDVLRKRRAGVPLSQSLDAGAYQPGRRVEIYREMAVRAEAALAAGASVIADGTFAESETRNLVAHAGEKRRFYACWLDAPLDVRLQRIGGRRGDASDADAAVATAQTEPADLPPSWRKVNANRPISAIVDDILANS